MWFLIYTPNWLDLLYPTTKQKYKWEQHHRRFKRRYGFRIEYKAELGKIQGINFIKETIMPSKSKKQHNLMEAVANNPAFAKKAKIPTSIGKDFATADKGKFKQGGYSTKKPKNIKPRGRG